MAGQYESRAVVGLDSFITNGTWASTKAGKPPLWPGAAFGEVSSTVNHRLEAIVVGYCGANDMLYRAALRAWYADEKKEGHMRSECMTVSHWHHHAAAHAAAYLHATKTGDTEVAALALEWFAINHALRHRFWVPEVNHYTNKRRQGSAEHPCARGWGGWKKGDVAGVEQHSPMADDFYRFVVAAATDSRAVWGAYSEGLDAESVSLLKKLPGGLIYKSACLVDVTKVKLIAPIYERTDRETGTRPKQVIRWWNPPERVTKTRPTVYRVTVSGNEDDFDCDDANAHLYTDTSPVRIGV